MRSLDFFFGNDKAKKVTAKDLHYLQQKINLKS